MNITVDLSMVKRLRKKAGLSISMVSDHLGYKTPTGYWLVEKGERKCSVPILYCLSKLYDVAMEDFIVEEHAQE